MATSQNNVEKVVRHRECLRNLRDGCTGFEPSGEDGTPESVFCAVCRCHRKFHRAEEIMQVVTTLRRPSAPAPALPAAPKPPVVRVYTRRRTHHAPPPQAPKDEGDKEKGKKAAAGESVKKGKRRRLILTAELEERLARKSKMPRLKTVAERQQEEQVYNIPSVNLLTAHKERHNDILVELELLDG
ncbi:hypothetical protein RJ640_025571 [Escallonia rubra]|uniref:ZF-HD dimerization-type domain-containing protein n=1 Tax=Escallonia rubra TaxID=112253 RepID=A0AA88U0T8_9ASTE|nr:hypothetical protein RJ640_025571 [Escallonia rubra]